MKLCLRFMNVPVGQRAYFVDVLVPDAYEIDLEIASHSRTISTRDSWSAPAMWSVEHSPEWSLLGHMGYWTR